MGPRSLGLLESKVLFSEVDTGTRPHLLGTHSHTVSCWMTMAKTTISRANAYTSLTWGAGGLRLNPVKQVLRCPLNIETEVQRGLDTHLVRRRVGWEKQESLPQVPHGAPRNEINLTGMKELNVKNRNY